MTTTPAPKGADIERRDLLDDDGENRAVRSFLMLFQQRAITVLAMRNHMELSGWHGCWPEWVNDPANEGHLTKGGAQHWIRHLLSLESGSSTSTSQGAPEAGKLVWMEAHGESGGYWGEQSEEDAKAYGQRHRLVRVLFDSADSSGNSGAAPGAVCSQFANPEYTDSRLGAAPGDALDAARYRAIRQLMETAKGSASIEVNQHLAYYDTCEPGEEVKLQWYPDTPIGFYAIEASTFDEMADAAIAASTKGDA